MSEFTLKQHSPYSKKTYLFPTDDIDGCIDWFPRPSTDDNWECVTTGDRWDWNWDDYVYWQDSSMGTDLYQFGNISLGATDTINYVKLHVVSRCYPDAVGDDEEFYLVTSPDSVCTNVHLSDDKNLTTGWKDQTYVWEENPATSSAWAQSEVNSAAFGVSGKGEISAVEWLDDLDDGGSYVDMYRCLGTGLLVTVNGTNLYVYAVDTGGDYVEMASVAAANGSGVWAEQARQSGTVGEMYIYVARGADGLGLYYYDGATTITLIDTDDQGGVYGKVHGWAYNDIHFIANGSDTSYTRVFVTNTSGSLMAYETTNNEYGVPTDTELDFTDAISDGSPESYVDVYCEDYNKLGWTQQRIHVTCDDVASATSHIRAYTYSPSGGGTLAARGTHNVLGHPQGIFARQNRSGAGDTEVFYCNGTSGLTVLKWTYGSSTYAHADWDDQGGTYQCVVADRDSNYVYVGTNSSGIYQYSYFNDVFTYIGDETTKNNAFGIDCYDTYVYTAAAGLGVELYSSINTQTLYAMEVWLEVDYNVQLSTCTLSKPERISTDHARNIKMINFWNGTREVYDLNRSGKSMILEGMEYYNYGANPDPCDRIECVRDMARNGAVITINELVPNYYNGDFRIRSFGWNYIGDKPIAVKWQLELEDNE